MQKNQFTKTVIDLGLLEPSNILHSSDDEDSTGTDSASARDYHTNKVNRPRNVTLSKLSKDRTTVSGWLLIYIVWVVLP